MPCPEKDSRHVAQEKLCCDLLGINVLALASTLLCHPELVRRRRDYVLSLLPL
jgi:hypothetical protein